MAGKVRPRVWCLNCGADAIYVTNSMDPKHPIVHCQRRTQAGELYSCGRLVGTVDQDEAEGLALDAHRKRVAAKHDRHVISGRKNRECEKCAETPTTLRTPHPQGDPFTDRMDAHKHLSLVHGDRVMMQRMSTRTLDELNRHHRSLHGGQL